MTRIRTVKPITYELLDGKNILVLPRRQNCFITDVCPFCGLNHSHSKGEGFRIAHCPNNVFFREGKGNICENNFFTAIAPDETILYAKNGYIIREYPPDGN